jgi:hypothetical protein
MVRMAKYQKEQDFFKRSVEWLAKDTAKRTL